MSLKILNTSKNLLAEIINYIVIISLLIMLWTTRGMESSIPTLILLITVPLLLYVVRVRVNKLPVFLLCHIAIPAAGVFVFAHTSEGRVILAVISLIFTVISIVIRFKTSEPGETPAHPFFAGVIYAFSLIVMKYMEDDRSNLIPWFVLLYAALYLIFMYLQHFLWFDFINRKTITNMPTGTTFKAGSPYVIGVSAFYFVAALLCLNKTLIQRLADGIYNLFVRFIKWLTSLIPAAEVVEEVEETPYESVDMTEVLEKLPSSSSGPSKLAEALEKVVIYMAIIIATAVVIYLIFALILKIVRSFKARDNGPEVEENENYEEIRERIKRTETKKQKEKRPALGSPRERIRRLYIKLVRKNEKLSENPEFFTAREFAELFPDDVREHALSFAKIYEKARYSEGACTASDVSEAKKELSYLM